MVLAIETAWKEEITDLLDTILRVVCHAEINKGNDKDTADNVKVLAIAMGIQRASQGMCTTQECIDRGSKPHYSDQYWVKDPDL